MSITPFDSDFIMQYHDIIVLAATTASIHKYTVSILEKSNP